MVRFLHTLALLLVATLLGAQERQPPLIGGSTTRLVEVQVVATHRGAPVEGLRQEDFTVTDNGRTQTVRLFSVAKSGGELPTAPAPRQGVFTNRLAGPASQAAGATVILLDSLNTRFNDRAFARNEIVKYLKSIQPDDRIGVYALGSSLQVLHEFTSPARELLALLENYRAGGELPGTRAASSKDPLAQRLDTLRGAAGVTQEERATNIEGRVRDTLHALESIADHLAGVPGRKNVIWISSAFPPWFSMSASSGRKSDFGEDIAQCVRAISSANVAIYPVNARGLTLPPGFKDSSVSGFGSVLYEWQPQQLPPAVSAQDSMMQLAEGTGGRAYYNTNDLAKAIREAVSDTRLTYTLGYYPDDREDGGRFHAIKVHVNRPGVELNYRSGYYHAAPRAPDVMARKAELEQAAAAPLDATGLAIQVKLGPLTPPHQVECLLHIAPENVHFEPQGGRWTAALDILLLDRSAEHPFNGKEDQLRLQLTEENYRRVVRTGIVYRQLIELEPGATELRIVVRDAVSGAIGSVTAPLTSVRQVPLP